MREINYIKAAFTNNYNYYIIAAVIFLMLAIGGFWGWLYLLAAIETGVFLFANTEMGKRYLYITNYKQSEGEMLESEQEIYSSLDSDHRYYLDKVRKLCQQITKRSTSNSLLERLSEFRYKYAVLLDEHYQLENSQPTKSTIKELENEIESHKRSLQSETSGRLRSVIQTNIDILVTRLHKLKQTGDRKKELEMHLEIVKNSLELILEDAISAKNDDDVLTMVDSLVANVEFESKDVADYSIDDLKLPVKKQEVIAVKRSK
jgi:hypothetical protein